MCVCFFFRQQESVLSVNFISVRSTDSVRMLIYAHSIGWAFFLIYSHSILAFDLFSSSDYDIHLIYVICSNETYNIEVNACANHTHFTFFFRMGFHYETIQMHCLMCFCPNIYVYMLDCERLFDSVIRFHTHMKTSVKMIFSHSFDAGRVFRAPHVKHKMNH